MLHVAALVAGLAGLWIILAWTANPAAPAAELVAAGVFVAVLTALWTARLGGVDRESAPHWRVLRLAPLFMRRISATLQGAGAAARAAIAADVTLRPALVRIRTRRQSDASRSALAHFISAAPGGVIVDIDGDGMLAHVLQEEALDAPQLAALETQVVQAVDGAAS